MRQPVSGDSQRAVVFDLDGTLVDTEGYYNRAAGLLAKADGVQWGPSEDQQAVGMSLDDLARMLIQLGVQKPVESIVHQVAGEVTAQLARSIPWLPGAQSFITSLHAAGYRLGLATMAYRESVEKILRSPGAPHFDTVVTGDEVLRGKPDPEVYLEACRKLEVDPRNAVAIEDSRRGLLAASAAGLRTIAVPKYESIDPALSQAVWTTLCGKTAEDLP